MTEWWQIAKVRLARRQRSFADADGADLLRFHQLDAAIALVDAHALQFGKARLRSPDIALFITVRSRRINQ